MKPTVPGLSIIGLLFVLGIALAGVYGIYTWRNNLRQPDSKPPVIIGEVVLTPSPTPAATPAPVAVQPTVQPAVPQQLPLADGSFPETGPADTGLILLGGAIAGLAARHVLLSTRLKKAVAQANRRILG